MTTVLLTQSPVQAQWLFQLKKRLHCRPPASLATGMRMCMAMLAGMRMVPGDEQAHAALVALCGLQGRL